MDISAIHVLRYGLCHGPSIIYELFVRYLLFTL